MKKRKAHGTVFAGIGGELLAAHWMGWQNVFWVEKNPYCRDILRRRFKGTDGHILIETFSGKQYAGLIDIFTGGFPCKQTSIGAAIHKKRNGLEGVDSGLWLQEVRLIKEIAPTWAIVENPSGVKKWEDKIQDDLAGLGYTVSRLEFTADCFGLPHSRRRCFYVANADGQRLEVTRPSGSPTIKWVARLTANGGHWLQHSPGDGGGIDGLPHRVDRIEAIGNSCSPFMMLEIFKAIEAL